MVFLYLLAPVLANLAIAAYGPSAVIWVSILLVGFVMTARDHLHDRWVEGYLAVKMGGLILVGGLISAAINIEALPIALASMAAFTVSEALNALVYQPMLNREVPWMKRVNFGNVFNATADSLIFVTLAFGFMPWLILGQIGAKILGGFLWSGIIGAFRKEEVIVNGN